MENNCELQGRDRSKHKQKQVFTEHMFKANGDFSDAYWELSVQDSYQWEQKAEGRWILRQKAENDHGGGR